MARAEELGVDARKGSDHWKVGNDAVTWLFGHMYENAPPEYYNQAYKNWSIENLPIIPGEWKLLPAQDKKKHIAAIRALLKESNHVVNAGDAGREGQLLVDELLIELQWDPFSDKTSRLWVRSVARKDLLDALKSMAPNRYRKPLYESAVCRQRADWLLGMNTTRLFTSLARRSGANMLVSVGRVQTPTLKLVVDRDLEIKNFRPVDHYLPQVTFEHENGSFLASWVIPDDHEGLDPEGRLVDRAVAERIAAKVDGEQGEVESFSAQKKSKSPPLPYSLSALQTECSAKFGLSAQQTLDVAQSLYEQYKVATYPRSDSRYLPLSILKDEAPAIIRNLAGTQLLGDIAEGANLSIKSAAWNDAKVSDHHGIIPTTEATEAKIAALPDLQKKVFLLIAKSFLAQFYPDMRYLAVSATVLCEEERFRASGRRVTDVGWQKVYGKENDEEEAEEEDSQAVPDMSKGDLLAARGTKVTSRRTKPPARFTDGTLVQAMTNIHRFVTTPEIKKRLRENDGIGTEATRANIIETLIRRKYLQRKGRHLVSTEAGQSIIAVLPEEVTDPGLTAVWESYLEKINTGEMTSERFMAGQIEALQKRIAQHRDRQVSIKGAPVVRPLEGHGETCDVCGKGQMMTREIRKGEHKGKKFLACSAWSKDDPNSCRNIKWPKPRVEPVKGHGETCPACGKGKMVTRVIGKGEHKGKKFLACDSWSKDDPNSCRHVVWPERKKVKPLEGDGQDCPKCGKGKLVTREITRGEHKGKRFLSCDNWKKDDPSSCSYSVFPQPKVEKLPGDGDVCPKCGKGKMVTRMIGQGENKGKRFLSCDNWRKDDPSSCSNRVFPEDKVEKLPGDGDPCPECKEGRKATRMIRKGDRKGERFLSCSRYPECKFAENSGGSFGKARGAKKTG